MKKFDIPSETYDNAKENLTNFAGCTGTVLAWPFMFAGALIAIPLIFLGLMIFGFDHH